MLIQTAKITPAISSEHDRLVTLVLLAREFEIFHRKKKDGTSNKEKQEEEEAILPNGQRFWTDLPYLVEEIQDAWTNESKGFTATERHNFAVFTAKLCAVGVCDNELSSCALWSIREALETERSITKAEGAPLSIADILPACLSWFQHNNFKLLKLAVQNYNDHHTSAMAGDDVQPSIMAPGHLAVKANVTQSGFSVARWLFWRQWFQRIESLRERPVAKLGKEGFEEMVRTGIALGYDIPGEKKYWEKVFEALDQEFVARGRKGCVGPDDVEIDMDWAD